MKTTLILAVSGLLIVASPAWAGSLSVSGGGGVSAGVSAGAGSLGAGSKAGIGASVGASGDAAAGTSAAYMSGNAGISGTLKTQSDGSKLLVITNFNHSINASAQSDQLSAAGDMQASGEATAATGNN
jgi:hypothetical protein